VNLAKTLQGLFWRRGHGRLDDTHGNGDRYRADDHPYHWKRRNDARFIHYMLARNIRVEADLVDQLFNSTEKRLARTLLLLARYGGEEPERVLQKVSQETLAEMIGTTRSRVNLFMNKFKRLGFIEYNGEIKINKSLLTVVLHE
jgi:Crp-like helix-turn-helix domain